MIGWSEFIDWAKLPPGPPPPEVEPPYAATPAHFDGTNDRLSHTTSLGAGENNGLFSICGWVRTEKTTQGSLWHHSAFEGFIAFNNLFDTTYDLRVLLENTAGAVILEMRVNDGVLGVEDGEWHFLALCVDMSSAELRHLIWDGAEIIPTWTTYTDGTIDHVTTTGWSIGSQAEGSQSNVFEGDVADLRVWFDYVDWSDPAILAQVITSAGEPVDPGETGSVDGKTPVMGFWGPVDDWHLNKGAGDGFTEVGALTEGTGPVHAP